MNDTHLTARQFDQLLFARDSESSQLESLRQDAAHQHLHGCTTCRQELEQLSSTLGNLRSATTAWAALEAPSFDPGRSLGRNRVAPKGLRFAWAGGIGSLALAASLLVSVNHTSGFLTGHPHDVPASAQAISPVGPTDEALLSGVESDLADSVPPSLAPLSVATTR